MDDKEKIQAAITRLKRLKKMVGFFIKKEIGELIADLEQAPTRALTEGRDKRVG